MTRHDFYCRQIMGSVNFLCGNDFIDTMHGYLNYQIEHHLWPDMTMLQYRKAQPLVKALAAKYGVSYVKESALLRTLKTVRIMAGLMQHTPPCTIHSACSSPPLLLLLHHSSCTRMQRPSSVKQTASTSAMTQNLLPTGTTPAITALLAGPSVALNQPAASGPALLLSALLAVSSVVLFLL